MNLPVGIEDCVLVCIWLDHINIIINLSTESFLLSNPLPKGEQIPTELADLNPKNEYQEIIVCSKIGKLRFQNRGCSILKHILIEVDT